jgi:hypothetical protein
MTGQGVITSPLQGRGDLSVVAICFNPRSP